VCCTGEEKIMLDRFTIDDGRHLPEIIINEDASAKVGKAVFRAGCSCGQMEEVVGTREQAMLAHVGHAGSKLGPEKGPEWLPVGIRLALLMVTMLAVWGGCYMVGQTQDSTAVQAGAHLVGMLLAFSTMVAARKYIAQTKA
jgi:hypothetical protein